MASAKHAEAQLLARAADDLSAAKSDGAAALVSTLQGHSESLQSLCEEYARRGQRWTESNKSAEAVIALLQQREELLGRRCTADLESRESSLGAECPEFGARRVHLE